MHAKYTLTYPDGTLDSHQRSVNFCIRGTPPRCSMNESKIMNVSTAKASKKLPSSKLRTFEQCLTKRKKQNKTATVKVLFTGRIRSRQNSNTRLWLFLLPLLSSPHFWAGQKVGFHTELHATQTSVVSISGHGSTNW